MDDSISTSQSTVDAPAAVRTLTRPQRRVLGVLIEKGLTTPDSYPLTLKAVTAGCNQKSNRDPVTNYSEDAVEETLDALRQLGLAAVVHTESGRTERYRHFARKRYPFTEPQLAIITELLLRGRQQLGELRSRASRMVPIDDQSQLRDSLQQLLAENYVSSSGPLERRGIEVDHTFYEPNESPGFGAVPVEQTPSMSATGSADGGELRGRAQVDTLEELRGEVQQLKDQLGELIDDMVRLKQSLGI